MHFQTKAKSACHTMNMNSQPNWTNGMDDSLDCYIVKCQIFMAIPVTKSQELIQCSTPIFVIDLQHNCFEENPLMWQQAAAWLLTLEMPPALSIHPDYSRCCVPEFMLEKQVALNLCCHVRLSGTGAKSKFSSSTVNTSVSEDTLKSGLTSSGKESCGPYRPVTSSKQVKAPALFPQTTCKVW